MCELLGLSSSLPTTLDLSLERFASHGRPDGRNPDGWGIAYHEARDIRLLKEPAPAASSEWLGFLSTHRIRSRSVVAHIRRATQGGLTFENTQPFGRELGGRAHVFAHNGHLPGIERGGSAGGRFRPMGDTDSEQAFCALLRELEPLWLGAGEPTLEERRAVIERFAEGLRELGPSNFLYTDGQYLFAHGHRRCQAAGRPPEPPGLHVLERHCAAESSRGDTGGLDVRAAPHEQWVVLVTSVPLSGERWRPLDEGEVLVIAGGELVSPP